MSKLTVINIAEQINGSLAVSSEDGQKIHDLIASELRAQHMVRLSFQNIDTLISAFLNTAVGQLYGEFPEETIRKLLSVEEIAPDDVIILKRVVDNAKMYFSNRESFDKAWKDEVDDEE